LHYWWDWALHSPLLPHHKFFWTKSPAFNTATSSAPRGSNSSLSIYNWVMVTLTIMLSIFVLMHSWITNFFHPPKPENTVHASWNDPIIMDADWKFCPYFQNTHGLSYNMVTLNHDLTPCNTLISVAPAACLLKHIWVGIIPL
jgi:hypothetical protein